MHGELIKDIVFAIVYASDHDIEIGDDVIQARHMQHGTAHTDQKSGTRARVVGGRQQGAVHSHGLCGIFDTAGAAELTATAQRMIDQAMTAGLTMDLLFIPPDDVIKQAHATLMWNMRSDPGVV
jgi:hypothetical protein